MSLNECSYNDLMEYGFWIAFGAIATLVLAVAAFVNILRDARFRKKGAKLRKLDEIIEWANEVYQMMYLSINWREDAKRLEARNRLSLLIQNSIAMIPLENNLFDKDFVSYFTRAVNSAIKFNKEMPEYATLGDANTVKTLTAELQQSLFELSMMTNKRKLDLEKPGTSYLSKIKPELPKNRIEVYLTIALGLFGFSFLTSGWHKTSLLVLAILFALGFLILAFSMRFKWGWLNWIAEKLTEVRFGFLPLFLGLSTVGVLLAQTGYKYAAIIAFIVACIALLVGFIRIGKKPRG